MKYHILNGDALKEQLKLISLRGTQIIARECLVDGEVKAKDLETFWKVRENFIHNTYDETTDYIQKGKAEFEQIKAIEEGAEVNLWFEEDLFCQVNLWFCAYLIIEWKIKATCFWIAPPEDDWKGFGSISTPEALWKIFLNRRPLKKETISMLSNCWLAYQQDDFDQLNENAFKLNDTFPQIKAVVQAHVDRFPKAANELSRPEQTIKAILTDTDDQNFGKVFQEFCRLEGIYGFGDLQVKRIYDRMKSSS